MGFGGSPVEAPAVENSQAAVWVRGDQSHKSQSVPLLTVLSQDSGAVEKPCPPARFLVPSKWIQDKGGRKGVG